MADTTSEHIAATRAELEAMEQVSLKELGPCPPDLEESILEIPLKDGFISHTILVRPVAKSLPLTSGANVVATRCPLIVLTHGGSFTYCSPNNVLSPARACASHFNAIVACIEYKLSPEYRFPAAPQSAWEVIAWLSEPSNLNEGILKPEGLEFDPRLGFVLGGMSAGANITAVIAGIDSAAKAGGHDELVQGLPEIASSITGLFITVPYMMESEAIPNQYLDMFRSHDEHADAPFLNAKSLEDISMIYKQDVRSPWFSPLNLDLAKIQKQHPGKVYVQCGQLDILRDDAVIYERVIRDRGLAETKMDVLQGHDHACWCNLPLPQAHTTEVKEKTMDGMSWLVGMDWDKSRPLSH
ncbi:hypothetical protein TruAng_004543 [Truncatella angustata]|nr:hypothetical protein TruAng_004543 [Truncatella angustata]